jgi:hypothetical protein
MGEKTREDNGDDDGFTRSVPPRMSNTLLNAIFLGQHSLLSRMHKRVQNAYPSHAITRHTIFRYFQEVSSQMTDGMTCRADFQGKKG